MKVLFNDDQDELYCIECKSRINLGEKYVQISESYGGEKYFKCFHPECLPETEEDEDYINE